MEERNMKNKLAKETNNTYVDIFKQKVARDEERERIEAENLRQK